ncbi:hypothetical protein K501DRAFT_287452 [Backusella circina FSU 941]|nr:hypothetical protein K501DRAFT_287452 [Backusella circina FSU 941]
MNGPRIVTRYSRPINFVKEADKNPIEIPKKKVSNGDDIASFYKQITSSNDMKKEDPKPKVDSSSSTIWCESCQCNVAHHDYQRHIRGTAHGQSKDMPSPSVLILNSKNMGYKMLETQGWKYQEGLGPTGEGRRHPISTVLKQDRLCIGHAETGKKAVTHKYREIEKKAIQKHRMELLRQRPSGKQLARSAKRETEERKRLLAYLNQ